MVKKKRKGGDPGRSPPPKPRSVGGKPGQSLPLLSVRTPGGVKSYAKNRKFSGLALLCAENAYNSPSMARRDAPREPLTEADILAHLTKSRKPQSLREIAAALGLRHAARRAMTKLVRKMKRRGDIQEYPNGRVSLPKEKQAAAQSLQRQAVTPPRRDWQARNSAASTRPPAASQLTGRLVAHRDGYGFVVPDAPREDLEGDLFIGRDAIGDAMHGDRVLASIERRGPAGGAASRAEGRIVRVLDRAHTTVVGLFRYGSAGNTVAPYESRLLQEIVIPPGEELTPEL